MPPLKKGAVPLREFIECGGDYTRLKFSRAVYMDELLRLVEAIVRRHGALKVGAVHELANQEIVQGGILGAAERVRERP